MDILRNFDNFINEGSKTSNSIVDSDKEMKSFKDVPSEVFETSKRILNDIFDRVRKPVFEYDKNKGLIVKFFISETDFKYIDEDEILTLDEGVRKKRTYDVSLEYLNRITETFEVEYRVRFEMLEDTDEEEYLEDENDDIIIDDDYETPNPDDLEYFDEDQADTDIKKGKIKIQDFDHFDEDDEE